MSYSGDFESQEQEDYYHEQYRRTEAEKEQNFDVMPCGECGNPMYVFDDNENNTRCDSCIAEEAKRTVEEEITVQTGDDNNG